MLSLVTRNTGVVVTRRFLSVFETLQHSFTQKASQNSFHRYGKVATMGFGAGAVLSSVYIYSVYKKSSNSIPSAASAEGYFLKEMPPPFIPARSIRSSADKTRLKMTLYQYQTCPFCCKVRAFLDYYGFSYDVVEVNSVTRSQTRWTTYRKVPFLVIEQPNSEQILQLKDSSMIMSALQSLLVNPTQSLEDISRCFPTLEYVDEDGIKKTEIVNRYSILYGHQPSEVPRESIVSEKKWRQWTDDVYVHVLSPNVYRTVEESVQSFSWFSKAGNWEENFATWERYLAVYLGPLAMYFIGKRLKKRHHLKDDVRLSFYEETNYWLKHLKKKPTKFMGGEEPGLSDLGVYGVLTAIEGCDAFQDLLNNTKIGPWFYSVKEAVNAHMGSKHVSQRGPV